MSGYELLQISSTKLVDLFENTKVRAKYKINQDFGQIVIDLADKYINLEKMTG